MVAHEHAASPRNESAILPPGSSPCWGSRSVAERAAYLRELRVEMVGRQESIARSVSLDTRKPVVEALCQEVTATLEVLRHLERKGPAWLAPRSLRYVRPGFERKRTTLVPEPVGRIAIIGPGNFPFSIPVMQSAYALMAGNDVVLKPSELCPHTSREIADLFAAVLPHGVVLMVEGGPEAAESVIAAPEVRKVFFTGSTEVGRNVAALCGRWFKPCVLELGGTGPAIVCRDADLDHAAAGILWSALYAGGNSCIGTGIVYAEAPAAGPLAERLSGNVNRLTLGDPLCAETDVASSNKPRIRLVRMDGSVAARSTGSDAREDAEPVCAHGEGSPTGDGRQLLEVCEVASAAQAVVLANRLPQGLSASVWTRNLRTGRRLAQALESSTVWVNDAAAGQPQFPWAARKASGWGSLYARQGMAEWTSVKVICTDASSTPKRWWFPYSRGKQALFSTANRLVFGRRRFRVLRALWRERKRA